MFWLYLNFRSGVYRNFDFQRKLPFGSEIPIGTNSIFVGKGIPKENALLHVFLMISI